jgi:GGDEF domain-containing protein
MEPKAPSPDIVRTDSSIERLPATQAPYAELRTHRESIIASAPPLHAVIEPRSQALTKYAILHQGTTEALYQRAGAHYFAFIDFGHMSVLNDVGLRSEVDQILSGIKSVADSNFSALDPQYKMIRIGGDEIGFLFSISAPHTSEDLSHAFFRFKEGIRELRGEVFKNSVMLSSSDSLGQLRLDEAEVYAAIRQGARSLVPAYQKHFGADSEQVRELATGSVRGQSLYLGWLLDEYRTVFGAGVFDSLPKHLYMHLNQRVEDSRPSDQKLERISLEERELLIAKVEVRLAQARAAHGPGQELLVPRIAIVDLDSIADSRVAAEDSGIASAIKLHLALGMADKVTHQIQRGEIGEDLLPVAVSDDVHKRAEEWAEIRFVNQSMLRFAEIRARLTRDGGEGLLPEINEGLQLLTADPSLERSCRLDLIKHLELRTLIDLGPQEQRQFAIVRFDLPGAGAVNNHGSYRKLDALMKELTEIIRKESPDAFIVRANGGSLFVMAPSTLKSETVDSMREQMNACLAGAAAQLPYARREFLQKTQLREIVREGQVERDTFVKSGRIIARDPFYFQSFDPTQLTPQTFLVVSQELGVLEVTGTETFLSVFRRWEGLRSR